MEDKKTQVLVSKSIEDEIDFEQFDIKNDSKTNDFNLSLNIFGGNETIANCIVDSFEISVLNSDSKRMSVEVFVDPNTLLKVISAISLLTHLEILSNGQPEFSIRADEINKFGVKDAQNDQNKLSFVVSERNN